MTTATPRIALISATPAAISPATQGMAAAFPEAEVWNLLDDRLITDADTAGGLTPALAERMERLIAHAIDAGAAGILLTCSMYGSIARATRAAIPVLAPDEAAFDEVIASPAGSVLVVASLRSALDDAIARFGAALDEVGVRKRVVGALAPGAFGAASEAALADALEEAVRPLLGEVDVLLLAQYSLAPAAEALAARIGVPVVAGPLSAAARLRAAIT